MNHWETVMVNLFAFTANYSPSLFCPRQKKQCKLNIRRTLQMHYDRTWASRQYDSAFVPYKLEASINWRVSFLCRKGSLSYGHRHALTKGGGDATIITLGRNAPLEKTCRVVAWMSAITFVYYYSLHLHWYSLGKKEKRWFVLLLGNTSAKVESTAKEPSGKL